MTIQQRNFKDINMAIVKSFKISQLPEMKQSNIDNNDLLLVSDHTGGKYPFESKKLQVGTYSNYLQAKIQQAIQPQISAIVNEFVEEAITQAISQQVSAIAQQVLEDELPQQLSVALEDYDFDTIVKDSLDRISDGAKDDTVLVNGGDAEHGGELDEI